MRAASVRTGLGYAVFRPAVLATAIALAGCAAKPEGPDTGKWKFERSNDPVSGMQVTKAWLMIERTNFLSGETVAGAVQLMCFRHQPVVRFSFSVKIGTDKTAALAYRFDDNPGRDVSARFFARPQIIVVDNNAEVAQFVNELARAQTLYLRISTLTVGDIRAKFPVHGAPYALEAAYSQCPIDTGKPKTRTSLSDAPLTARISAARAPRSPPRAA